jgi:two-component system phosphate regulon response regulator PhoB
MSQETVGVVRSVLVVEDDRFLRRACEVSLLQRGFTVLTAPDGEAALELIRAELPGLVLLDLLMPRMSGLELLRRLRSEERTRALPVLVISNSSREQDVAELERLGITGYLVKANLSLEELGDTVSRILEA